MQSEVPGIGTLGPGNGQQDQDEHEAAVTEPNVGTQQTRDSGRIVGHSEVITQVPINA